MATKTKKIKHHSKTDIAVINFGKNGGQVEFPMGKAFTKPVGDGAVMTVGEVKGADGTLYDAILDLDMQSSGEHWGTLIVLDDGITDQRDEDFLEKLGKDKDEFFPYKYRYFDKSLRSGDIHVGAGGWS